METEPNPSSLSRRNQTGLSQDQILPTVPVREPELKDKAGPEPGQFLAGLRRRALVILGVTAAATSAAYLFTVSRTPTYHSKFQLLIAPLAAEVQDPDPNAQENAPASVSPSVDYQAQSKVLLSPKLIDPVVEKLQAQYPDLTYDSLRQDLKIGLPQDAGKGKILEVRYQNPAPQKVKQVLNALVPVYLQYGRQQRQTTARQGLEFVNRQIPSLQTRIAALEKQLQSFRQQYGLIDPDAQGKQLTDQIAAIQKQRQQTQLQLNEAQTRYAGLQRQTNLKPEEAIAGSVLSQAPDYQKLLERLREVESQLALESAQYTDEHPRILYLRDQRQKLLPLIEQEAQRAVGRKISSAAAPGVSAYQNSVRLEMTQQLVEAANQIPVLQTQLQALSQTEAQLGQQAKQFPAVARRDQALQRQLATATNQLNQLLDKREALQFETATQKQKMPWELVLPPTEPDATVPSLERNLALGALLGLLLGIGIALLLERLNTVLYTSRDVKVVTRLPILGTIPFQKQLKQLAPAAKMIDLASQSQILALHDRAAEDYVATPFSDAFRSLYKNIRFLRIDNPVRSVVISSAVPGEGKSTVAMNLAQAAAAMGQRVLLVDADLRRPQVHKLVGVANAQGLGEVVNHDLSLKTAIKPAPFDQNLYVLTAGEMLPDPTSLLSSQKMAHLVAVLPKAFNLIIYDAPPLGLADASLLAPQTDGLVMVTRLGKIERGVLEQAIATLEVPKAPVLGIVVNGVKEFSRSEKQLYHSYYQQPRALRG